MTKQEISQHAKEAQTGEPRRVLIWVESIAREDGRITTTLHSGESFEDGEIGIRAIIKDLQRHVDSQHVCPAHPERSAIDSATAELRRERDEWKSHAENSDKDLCQLWDALGDLSDDIMPMRTSLARINSLISSEARIDELSREIEDAGQFAAHAYYLIVGKSAEWSNAFGYD